MFSSAEVPEIPRSAMKSLVLLIDANCCLSVFQFLLLDHHFLHSLSKYVVCFITQKPQPLSKGTASNFWSFVRSLDFLTPISIGASRIFLAYHLADDSISDNFSPWVLFSLTPELICLHPEGTDWMLWT